MLREQEEEVVPLVFILELPVSQVGAGNFPGLQRLQNTEIGFPGEYGCFEGWAL